MLFGIAPNLLGLDAINDRYEGRGPVLDGIQGEKHQQTCNVPETLSQQSNLVERCKKYPRIVIKS